MPLDLTPLAASAMPGATGDDVTYRDAAWWLVVESRTSPEQRAIGLWALGRCLPMEQRMRLPDGRDVGKRELCIEAIRVDPQCALAYVNLGASISPTDRVHLADGRDVGQRELYMEKVTRRHSCWG